MLLIEVLDKDHFILLLKNLECRLAVRAHGQVPRLVICLKKDISVTNGTFDLFLSQHHSPPEPLIHKSIAAWLKGTTLKTWVISIMKNPLRPSLFEFLQKIKPFQGRVEFFPCARA
jgi:hypothetical protein